MFLVDWFGYVTNTAIKKNINKNVCVPLVLIIVMDIVPLTKQHWLLFVFSVKMKMKIKTKIQHNKTGNNNNLAECMHNIFHTLNTKAKQKKMK